ncbi:MAG TPA: dipeptide/oligopeptide/nickel ABC transporter ATP-binding protein, partial [Devosia sp.]|nr:dipeptide/oligopeptide/nickel ABC transporter ATP-binding protein [Devosia sp.]
MTALLDVRNVSKRFPIGGVLSGREIVAVEDATLSVGETGPEIFTIIGESGSGKTTLARMILGLERPSSGEIAFRGKPVVHRSRAERLAFMASVQPVFQNPFEAFNPLKKVDRYLASTAHQFLRLRDRAAIDAAMDGALQKVGLSLVEIRGRFPHELSGGQLQRVAIARALIPNPPLLIADEPVSMVDASLRMSIVNLLKQLRDDTGVSV